MIYKKRAMTTEKARNVRKQGNDDAKEFARLIGLKGDYRNDLKAKKDVVDFNGDAHSIKSGQSYWQIFLYSGSRFETDSSFKTMNGIGQIILDCINAIPSDKTQYQQSKIDCKNKIAVFMVKLREKLQDKYRFETFLRKAIFEGTQVSYLTVKQNGKFHVFWHDEVIKVFLNKFVVTNSGSVKGSIPNQKVLFKIDGKNCGEIEMRNGERHHHKEMKFRLHKNKIFNLLVCNIKDTKDYNADKKIVVYGKAIKKIIKKN